jgi:hypothetical protein
LKFTNTTFNPIFTSLSDLSFCTLILDFTSRSNLSFANISLIPKELHHQVEGKKTIISSGIDFPRNGLEQLQSILGLRLNSSLWNVVLVSFNLEPRKDSPKTKMYNEIAEIGVSMLDTRSFSLHSLPGSLIT